MIPVRGEITADSADAFIRAVKRAAGPVVVDIDSQGGHVTSALRMADAIAAHRGETRAHVWNADSAALQLAIACDTRTYEEGAGSLVHRVTVDVYAGMRVPVAVLSEAAKQAEWANSEALRRLSARSGRTEAYWVNLQAREVRLGRGDLRTLFPDRPKVVAALTSDVAPWDPWARATWSKAMVQTFATVAASGKTPSDARALGRDLSATWRHASTLAEHLGLHVVNVGPRMGWWRGRLDALSGSIVVVANTHAEERRVLTESVGHWLLQAPGDARGNARAEAFAEGWTS